MLVTAVMFAPLNNLNMGLCGLSLCISCSECTQQIITAIGARVHSTRPLLSIFVSVMSSVKTDSLTSDAHSELTGVCVYSSLHNEELKSGLKCLSTWQREIKLAETKKGISRVTIYTNRELIQRFCQRGRAITIL